jgi:hypothetical protein
MPHGADPLRVQMIRNQLNSSRINAVHLLKQRSCQTPVGLSRASTSSFVEAAKTWMAGTSPAMTERLTTTDASSSRLAIADEVIE